VNTTLICDFDGTLADSISGILGLVNSLAPRYGFRSLDHELFDRIRNLPFRQAAREMNFPTWKLGQAIRVVLHEYRHIIHSLEPYPGMVDVLKKLSSQGIRLGLISSNNTDNLHSFLEKHDIDFFHWVEGTHGILRKHRSIKAQMKKHGLKKENTFYIGDEVRDIKAARRSGIKVISVSWGLHSRQYLQNNKPDWLIDTPAELLELMTIKYHPNLQMGITCHSGRNCLWDCEMNRTGFRLCHSALWTFLDVSVSGFLQICPSFRVFSDHRFF